MFAGKYHSKSLHNSNNLFVIFLILVNWNTGSDGDSRGVHRGRGHIFRPDLTIDKDDDLVNLRNAHLTDEEDTSGCPEQFKRRCECKFVTIQDLTNRMPPKSRDKFVVNCTDSGFTSTVVLESMPPQTEELIFTGNKIPVLHRNIFGKADYPNLKFIDLSDNQIRVIDGQTFHHVSTVETLILNHNDLSNEAIHEHPRMFSNFYNLKVLHLTNTFNEDVWSLDDLGEIFHQSNLTALTRLHLEQNELELIANLSLFCALPALTDLYLGQNKLPDLNLDTTCFKNLDFIDLRANIIKTIKKESGLWKMTNLTNQRGDPIRVDLLENPINCDCSLRDFIHWLSRQSLKNADIVSYNEKLRCVEGLPVSNKGLTVKEIEITECPPPLQISNYNGVTTVVIWLLIIVSTLALVTTAYWNRGYCQRQMRPLLESSPNGVKYVSIEKEEEAQIAHV